MVEGMKPGDRSKQERDAAEYDDLECRKGSHILDFEQQGVGDLT